MNNTAASSSLLLILIGFGAGACSSSESPFLGPADAGSAAWWDAAQETGWNAPRLDGGNAGFDSAVPDRVATDTSPRNRAPEFLSSGNFAVAEGAAPGTLVGAVSARDPDGGELSFSLDAGGDSFVIANSGVISLSMSAKLDFETTPELTIEVVVADSAGLSAKMVVTVAVQDADDEPPLFTGPSAFRLDEGSIAPALVGVVSAEDPDTRRQLLRFSTSSELFAVDAVTGAITVSASDSEMLDYHQASEHRFLVSVTDGTNTPTELAVTVSLNNTTSGWAARPVNTTCVAPARPRSLAPIKATRIWTGVPLNEGYSPSYIQAIPGDPSRRMALDLFGQVVRFSVEDGATDVETLLGKPTTGGLLCGVVSLT